MWIIGCVKVRDDSYSRGRSIWGKKSLVSLVFPFFFLPPSLSHSLSLSSVACSSPRSLVKFSASFSGPNGRFLLVGCGGYITALMTRTSSCFLLPRLKVNLSGGGALQHPALCVQRASETHTHAAALFLSLSLPLRSMSLTLLGTAEDRGGDRRAKALFIYYIFFPPSSRFDAFNSLTLFQLFRLWEIVRLRPSIQQSSVLPVFSFFFFVRRRSSRFYPPLHRKGK